MCTKPGIGGKWGAKGGMGRKGWVSALSHFTFSVALLTRISYRPRSAGLAQP